MGDFLQTGLDLASLPEFFREGIERAARNQKISLLEDTQFYVVNLLTQACEAAKISDEPLASTLAKAQEAQGSHVRFRLLKDLGDRSLYVSGFFADSFRRKLIDIDYYIAMGEQAYAFVSSLSKEQRQADVFSAVFGELSEKFPRLVDLIAEISEASGLTSDQDLLRVYERWLHTGSDRLSGILKEKGIAPVRFDREPIH